MVMMVTQSLKCTVKSTMGAMTKMGAKTLAQFYTEKMGWKLTSKEAKYNSKTGYWEINFLRPKETVDKLVTW